MVGLDQQVDRFLDRLARNRVDDVEINLALRHAGAQLVSVTENIDETPSGMLVHGIMSSIAEFYSRNLATESRKGMLQKVKGGGTVNAAPFGYLNSRVRSPEGRSAQPRRARGSDGRSRSRARPLGVLDLRALRNRGVDHSNDS
ncbi:MAG TPA: recombinase family protein [Marmoricola sp.]|nr:recombinase family protein [Marmoricola sp.]